MIIEYYLILFKLLLLYFKRIENMGQFRLKTKRCRQKTPGCRSESNILDIFEKGKFYIVGVSHTPPTQRGRRQSALLLTVMIAANNGPTKARSKGEAPSLEPSNSVHRAGTLQVRAHGPDGDGRDRRPAGTLNRPTTTPGGHCPSLNSRA